MRSILVGACVLLVSGTLLAGRDNQEKKPDYVFWSLAAANIVAGALDCGYSMVHYQAGRMDEGNPVAKYLFDTNPWTAPVYMLATTSAVIFGAHLLNRLAFKPLGHLVLTGVLAWRLRCVYLVITIPFE